MQTLYYYDDTRILEEQNTTGTTLAAYAYGNYIDEMLSMDQGRAEHLYHQNALWSVEAVTDSTPENLIERYSYDAYGAPTITNGSFSSVPPNTWGTPHSAIGNPWMFTGRQLDEEDGLYFYRARITTAARGGFYKEIHSGISMD